MNTLRLFLSTCALAIGVPGIGTAASAEPADLATRQGYVPGLGDFMRNIQLLHAKLWYAGKGKNWQLAAYELDELKEAFADAANYQPNYEGKPIAEMIAPMTGKPFGQLERVIDARDWARFAAAYDGLSRACTSCHQAMGRDFISIQRPSVPPLTNQRFDGGHGP